MTANGTVRGGAAVAVLAVVVAACGSASGSSGARTAPAAAPPVSAPGGAPLPTALVTTSGTWSVLPMGQLGQPDETFWQTFVLPAGARSWILRTPPGVADNGGLVVASSGRQVTVGFRPTSSLAFSPLAMTTDGGRTYAGDTLVPSGLAAEPDSLATAPAGAGLAVAGGAVLGSADGLRTWSTVVSAPRVATAVRAGCGTGDVTAVGRTAAAVWLGVRCGRPGSSGLYRSTVGSAALPAPGGPTMPAGAGRATVLRIVDDGRGVAVLLGLAGGRYLAAWDPSGGDGWTVSPTLGAAGPLVSTSTAAGGALVVLTGGTHPVAAVAHPGVGWAVLPKPPSGTQVIAVSDGRIDALRGPGSVFVDERLAAGGWQPVQSLSVAIPYGSSS